MLARTDIPASVLKALIVADLRSMRESIIIQIAEHNKAIAAGHQSPVITLIEDKPDKSFVGKRKFSQTKSGQCPSTSSGSSGDHPISWNADVNPVDALLLEAMQLVEKRWPSILDALQYGPSPRATGHRGLGQGQRRMSSNDGLGLLLVNRVLVAAVQRKLVGGGLAMVDGPSRQLPYQTILSPPAGPADSSVSSPLQQLCHITGLLVDWADRLLSQRTGAENGELDRKSGAGNALPDGLRTRLFLCLGILESACFGNPDTQVLNCYIHNK